MRERFFPRNDESDEEDAQFVDSLRALDQQSASSHAPSWGGSVPGRQVIHRDPQEGYNRLFNDYFADPTVYPDYMFWRR